MKTRIGLLALVLVSATGMWATTVRKPNSALADAVSWIDQLKSDRAQVRSQAAHQLLSNRQRTVEGLVSIANDPSLREHNPEAVAIAIDLLGKLRAAQASDALVRLVRFLPPSWRRPPPPYPSRPAGPGDITRSPASDALVNIGSPALPAIVRFVSSGEADRAEMSLLAWVIHGIEGKQRGRIFLQEQLAVAETEPAKAGINTLLRAFEQTPP